METLPEIDILLRAGIFGVLLALILIAEAAAPRRTLIIARLPRWFSNLGLGALNILVLRLTLPFLGISLAVVAFEERWGLFYLLNLPTWLNIALSLLLLDLVIWAQHRLFHRLTPLWRLHRMHHADPDFDATTAVRFHPLEAVISMCIKSVAVLGLGINPLGFVMFEVLLSSTSLFNHGNLTLPSPVDRVLRLIIVTPDMHRVHHSTKVDEQNSNFGFNLPWWDRIFGTYRAQPEQGHEQMNIGTGQYREVSDQRIDRLLSQPFQR